MASTFELKSVQLARLLEMGGDAPEPAADELLREWLAQPLPGNERSCGELLHDPAAGADALTELKDHGKRLVRGAGSEAERAAATALYYAAIAAALVHTGAKISEHPDAKLAASFADLAARPWLPPGLAELLRRARPEQA